MKVNTTWEQPQDCKFCASDSHLLLPPTRNQQAFVPDVSMKLDLTHSLGSRGCSNKASLTWVVHVKKKKKILAPSCWNYQVLEELRGDFHVQLIWNPLGCSWMLRTAKCLQIWRWGLIQWWILLWVLEKKQAGMSRSWHWCHGGHVRPLWTLQAAFNHHA